MSAVGRLRDGLEHRAARGYVTADRDEALDLARRLGAAGVPCTLGYWDGPGAAGELAVSEAHRVLESLGDLDAVLAVKAPPLLDGVEPADAAALLAPVAPPIRLLVDAPSPAHADGAVALAIALAQRGCDAGIALPGRWRRSEQDAETAIEHGLTVRLVKGEHPDPSGDGPAAGEGFVALARRLAGRARHVGVASHDTPVAREALEALQQAGTSCELELLLGLPIAVQAVAEDLGVGVRAYVPWGTRAWVPYDTSAVRGDREIARRLLSDALVGQRRWKRTLALRPSVAERPAISVA